MDVAIPQMYVCCGDWTLNSLTEYSGYAAIGTQMLAKCFFYGNWFVFDEQNDERQLMKEKSSAYDKSGLSQTRI